MINFKNKFFRSPLALDAVKYHHYYYASRSLCRRMGLFGTLVTFGAGVYSGLYIAQHYNVPRTGPPQELWDRLREFLDEHKKTSNVTERVYVNQAPPPSSEVWNKLRDFLEQQSNTPRPPQ